jgi:hypothetical protein
MGQFALSVSAEELNTADVNICHGGNDNRGNRVSASGGYFCSGVPIPPVQGPPYSGE